MGFGDKEAVDQAAVDAMRPVLGSVSMTGVVVIGEGEKDNAPMLYNGEEIGDGSPPEVDIAVDPVDGTTLTAKSMPNAIWVVALSDRGTMFDPGPCVYMEKLVVGPEAADAVDFEAPLALNLRLVAKAKGAHVGDLTVCILDRPRHEDLIRQIRQAGARVKLITDGDVAGAIMAAREGTGVDMLVGIGGTPEAVIAACALKCLDGAMFGRLWPRNDDERRAALDAGYDLDKVLDIDDLVRGDNVFFAATGVTDGELLRGVRFDRRGSLTQSLSMRSKSGTSRQIDARHQLSKLSRYASIDYGLGIAQMGSCRPRSARFRVTLDIRADRRRAGGGRWLPPAWGPRCWPSRRRPRARPQQAAAAVPELTWRPRGRRPASSAQRPGCRWTTTSPGGQDHPGPDPAAGHDPSERIGSMFFNPGGPGGSGVDFLQAAGPFLYSDEVRARFDLVGFDPRGVAAAPRCSASRPPTRPGRPGAVRLPVHPGRGAGLDPGRPDLRPGLRRTRRADPGPHVHRQRGPRHGPAPPGGRRPQDELRRLLLRDASAPPTPTCSRTRSGRWSSTA